MMKNRLNIDIPQVTAGVFCVVTGTALILFVLLGPSPNPPPPPGDVDAPLKTFVVLVKQDDSLLRRAEASYEIEIQAHYFKKISNRDDSVWAEVEFYTHESPDPVAGFPRENVDGWWVKPEPIPINVVEGSDGSITFWGEDPDKAGHVKVWGLDDLKDVTEEEQPRTLVED